MNRRKGEHSAEMIRSSILPTSRLSLCPVADGGVVSERASEGASENGVGLD